MEIVMFLYQEMNYTGMVWTVKQPCFSHAQGSAVGGWSPWTWGKSPEQGLGQAGDWHQEGDH